MQMSSEQLDYWSDVFVDRGLSRFMTLPQFLRDPNGILRRFEERPESFIERDPDARNPVANWVKGTEEHPVELECKNLPRRNGRYCEPLHHHAYPR